MAVAGGPARSRIFSRATSTAPSRLDASVRSRGMAMPYGSVAAVGQVQVFHRCKRRLRFHINLLCKQLPGAGSRGLVRSMSSISSG